MKYLQTDKIFSVTMGKSKKKKILARPVNGEEHFNDVGFSQGFVHLADPITGECLGWAGVLYFEENAEEVTS